MDTKSLILDGEGLYAPMCGTGGASADLAASVSLALDANAAQISVMPSDVGVVWPWIEGGNLKIAARFSLSGDGDWDARMSDFATRVNAAFKCGAAAAQVFVRASELDAFCDALAPIRDDLFFNRELCIAIDLGDVSSDAWAPVFATLARVRADSVLFTLTRDTGDKSDYVGRLYGMLNTLDEALWDGQLRFAVGTNPVRIEQAKLLTQALRSKKLAKMIIFVNN